MGGRSLGHFIVRFRLDRMNEIGKLNSVLNKEDGNIISYQVIVTFFSVELDGKAARVAYCIGRTAKPCHSGKSHKYRSFHRRILQEFGFG